MIKFIIVLCGVLIAIRLYLNKFDAEHKDIIAIVLSLLLTSFLFFIQMFMDFILNLIRNLIK